MKPREIWLLVVCILVVLGTAIAVRAQECPGCPGASEGGAYESGNCTCYAWQRANSSVAWGYWFPGDLGHAYQWDNKAAEEPYNLFVGKIPYPDAIAVWEGYVYPANTSYGHVAYVTDVSGDANDTFRVSQMNINGYLGCVFSGEYAAKGMGESLHFIYPPRDNPTRLWPYEGFQVEYQETDPPSSAVLNLEWYGGSGSYDLQAEVQERDGNGNPVGSRELVGERFNLNAVRFNIYEFGLPMCPTIPLGTYYWRVKNAGSSSWSSWFSFELVGCEAPCSGTAFGPQSLADGGSYCPAVGNPTPIPTSTPFPTPTPAPGPTNTPPTSPGDLRQSSDLYFSPANPQIGEQVHFWFQVWNAGGEVITFTQIGPWGYGPNHFLWEANSHGEHALNPGEVRTINGYRYFDESGTWTVDGIHYQLLDDPEPRGYYGLPSDGYAAAGLEIQVVEPTPEPTYTPGPTQTPVCTPTEVPATATSVGQTPLPTATPPSTPMPTPCSPLVGDFDCDCQITITDIAAVADRWHCREGDDCYSVVYDLNHDGEADIVDIMLVAARWGEICPATPTPTRTPRPTATPEPPPTPGYRRD